MGGANSILGHFAESFKSFKKTKSLKPYSIIEFTLVSFETFIVKNLLSSSMFIFYPLK
jgi:hypothetical protein